MEEIQRLIYFDVTDFFNEQGKSGISFVIFRIAKKLESKSNVRIIGFDGTTYRLITNYSFNLNVECEIEEKVIFEKDWKNRIRLLIKRSKIIRFFVGVYRHYFSNAFKLPEEILGDSVLFDSGVLIILGIPVGRKYQKKLEEIMLINVVKIRFFIHDIFPITKTDNDNISLKYSFRKYLQLTQKAEKVFVPSHATKTELETFTQQSQNSFKIDVCQFAPREIDSKTSCSYQIDNFNGIRFLYVSNFINRKNHEQLLTKVSEIADTYCLKINLIFVGSFGPTLVRIKRLQKQKNSEFFKLYIYENMNNCCLDKIYEKCNALIYPSKYEGFGLPIMDALYRGIPVLTNQNSSMGELATSGGIITFDPSDEESLKLKIEELCFNNELISKLQTEIEKRKFRDWESVTNQIIEI